MVYLQLDYKLFVHMFYLTTVTILNTVYTGNNNTK